MEEVMKKYCRQIQNYSHNQNSIVAIWNWAYGPTSHTSWKILCGREIHEIFEDMTETKIPRAWMNKQDLVPNQKEYMK